MASTYTPLLRLTLPTTGELTGTWGNTVNTGITTLIENAIAGRVSVAHDDTANYTLTTANGSTDQARYAVVNITGTLTAARNVVCPTASKVYIVQNNTTGGFAFTFKTSAGTGISVANGATDMLLCDGTNVTRIFTNFTTGNLTVTGNTAIGDASGDTLTIAPNAVTWSNNPTHSGNHTFSGNVTIQGNTSIGDAAGDTLTFAPSAVTWSNNPTHSGSHTFNGTSFNASGAVSLGNNSVAQTHSWSASASGSINIGTTTAVPVNIATGTNANITTIGNTTGYVVIYGNAGNGIQLLSSLLNFNNATSIAVAANPTFTGGYVKGGFNPTTNSGSLSKGSICTFTTNFNLNTGTAGDYYLVYNDSGSSITIGLGTITTIRLAGTATTGARTLAQRGFGYIYYVSTNEAVVGGDGVT